MPPPCARRSHPPNHLRDACVGYTDNLTAPKIGSLKPADWVIDTADRNGRAENVNDAPEPVCCRWRAFGGLIWGGWVEVVTPTCTHAVVLPVSEAFTDSGRSGHFLNSNFTVFSRTEPISSCGYTPRPHHVCCRGLCTTPPASAWGYTAPNPLNVRGVPAVSPPIAPEARRKRRAMQYSVVKALFFGFSSVPFPPNASRWFNLPPLMDPPMGLWCG